MSGVGTTPLTTTHDSMLPVGSYIAIDQQVDATPEVAVSTGVPAIVDDSTGGATSPQSVSLVGTAVQSLGYAKDGTASLLVNAGYASVVDTNDFPDSSGAWTAEAWGKLTAVSATWRVLLYHSNTGSNPPGRWYIALDPSHKARFQWYNSAGTLEVDLTSTTTFNTTAEHHYAITFDGTNDWNLWVDGALEANATVAPTVTNYTDVFRVGADWTTSYWEGYVDLVRVSNVERYTGAFTPPTSLTDDANTMLLLPFEDGIITPA